MCLGVSLTPWGPLALYPFTLFTTWVHECGHAAAAVLLGGAVASVTIQPDTSGLTRSLMPASTLAQALVASAGYLTASIVGCFLLAASRDGRRAKGILWAIGALMLASLVLWIRNLFGAVVVVGVGGGAVAARRQAARTRGVAGFAMSVLAIQVVAQRGVRHPHAVLSSAALGRGDDGAADRRAGVAVGGGMDGDQCRAARRRHCARRGETARRVRSKIAVWIRAANSEQ